MTLRSKCQESSFLLSLSLWLAEGHPLLLSSCLSSLCFYLLFLKGNHSYRITHLISINLKYLFKSHISGINRSLGNNIYTYYTIHVIDNQQRPIQGTILNIFNNLYGERIWKRIYMHCFTVCLKLTQHYKSSVLQFKNSFCPNTKKALSTNDRQILRYCGNLWGQNSVF